VCEEKRAFATDCEHCLRESEFDLPENLCDPLPEVIEALQKYKSYDAMISHFPDVRELL